MTTNLEAPDLFAFKWERDSAGYDLRDGVLVGRGGDREIYSPSEEQPSPHRAFYELQAKPLDRMREFANQYGLLGAAGGGPPASEPLADFKNALIWLGPYVSFAHDDSEMSAQRRNEAFNRRSPRHMSVRMELAHGRTVLRVAPNSLLSWIWLRFAQEKALEQRQCVRPGCGTWFDVGAGASTSRREYCTPQCRALHNYRIKAGIDAAKPSKKEGTK